MGGRLAERQKSPKLKAKLGESFVVDVMKCVIPGSFFAQPDLARLLPFRFKHPAPRLHVSGTSYIIGERPRLLSGSGTGPADDCLPVSFNAFKRRYWNATGIRVFFRRRDFSSASAISAPVNCPVEDLAMISRHIADNDLPAWDGRSMITPCDSAHRTISAVV
jgi:hypothetical protein